MKKEEVKKKKKGESVVGMTKKKNIHLAFFHLCEFAVNLECP
jgi:hypothetical protein